MYWSRCEYEIVCTSIADENFKKKINIYWQILNNIDVITEILMKNVGAYDRN